MSWALVQKKDYERFGELLADDFYDVFSTGKTVDKRELLDRYIRGVELVDFDLSAFHVVMLDDDAAIVVYEARFHGRETQEMAHAGKPGELQTDHVAVTSAWARRNGRWLNVFYREGDLK
jgi:hypothetical protein